MNKYSLIKRKEIPPLLWDEFVEQHQHGWLFHTYGIVDALMEWKNASDSSYALIDDKARIIAIFPIICMTCQGAFGPMKITSIISSYLYDDTKLSATKIRDWLLEIVQLERIVELNITQHPLKETMTPFSGQKNPLVDETGFSSPREKLTWVIDLTRRYEEIKAAYKKRTRREIKLVGMEDIQVKEAKSIADLDEYYQLHLETCTRSEIDPHPYEYFERIFRDFIPQNLSRILLMAYKGKTISAQNTGKYKKGCCYWSGASNRILTGVNRFLCDAQIRHCQQEGYHYYDIGEAFPTAHTKKEKNLSSFKSSFGSVLYPYWHVCYRTPYKRCYDTAAKMKSKLASLVSFKA